MIIAVAGKAGSGKGEVSKHLVRAHGFVEIAFADVMKRICVDVFDFDPENLWGASEKRGIVDERYEHWRFEQSCDVCGAVYDGKGPPPKEKEEACGHAHMREAWASIQSGELPLVEYLSPRIALQSLGDWGRRGFKDIWVDYTLKIIKQVQTGDFYYDQQSGPRHWASVEGARAKKDFVISDMRFRNEFDRTRAAGGKTIRVIRPGAGLTGIAATHISEREGDLIEDDEFDLLIHNEGSVSDMLTQVDNWMHGVRP